MCSCIGVALPAHAAKPFDIDTYLETKLIKDMVVSAQGDFAVVKVRSYAGGKSFLYDYYLVRPGGEIIQLTSDGSAAGSFDISPDGTKLAYAGTTGGKSGLVAMSLPSGSAYLIKELPVDADNVRWNSGGIFFTAMVFPDCGADLDCTATRLAVKTKGSSALLYDYMQVRPYNFWRDGTYSNLFVVGESGGEVLPVAVGPFDMPDVNYGAKDSYTVSSDGNTVIFQAGVGVNYAMSPSQNLFITHREPGGAFVPFGHLTNDPAMDMQPSLSPDGTRVAYCTREPALYETGLTKMHVMDLATGADFTVDRGGDSANTSLTWSLDGKQIIFALDVHAHWPLRTVDAAAGATYRDVAGDRTYSNIYGQSKNRLWYTKESLSQPPALYINSMDGGDEKLVADFNPQLKDIAFGQVEFIQYTGPVDQDSETAQIDAFLIMPPQYQPGTKVPLVINVHGGPEMAFWNAFFNPSRFNTMALASMGFAVVSPNVRGSSGYGINFQNKVIGHWGGIPYKDVMALLDYLKNDPRIDTGNACVVGGSYGGYMANWIEARTDRFKCIVAGSSISMLGHMYSVTDQPFFNDTEMGGKPWEIPGEYSYWSPLNYVKNFKTPILVQMGGHDYRVPIDQGLSMFTFARVMGVEARLVYFPDEGHSPSKPKNVKALHDVIGAWFKKHLGL
jgi:dipeptidyl aminopeptidase/acylaminoacyl peptidase